jgi:hypothetical protein
VASTKRISYAFDTSLTLKDLALHFREGLQNPSGGVLGLVASKSLKWEFFTPDPSDDPFSELVQVEPPSFAVGASYGVRGLARGVGKYAQLVDSKAGGAVSLQIWDGGDQRTVLIAHIGDLSPASRKCVRSVLDEYVHGDPAIRIREEKGRVRF